MASSKEYLDFVLEQCSGLSACAMMGEYVLYYGGYLFCFFLCYLLGVLHVRTT